MKIDFKNYTKRYPDSKGYFGTYGGSFLDEKLQRAMDEVTEAYETIAHSAQFINELRRIKKEFQRRPTPVYHCERLSRELGTTQIYLKREDLNHTGVSIIWIYGSSVFTASAHTARVGASRFKTQYFQQRYNR